MESTTNKEKSYIVEGLILALLLGVTCFSFYIAGKADARREAIKNNAGEWTIDRETGAREFKWTGANK